METIQLRLDEPTLARARRLAAVRRCTLEVLLGELIEQLGIPEVAQDSFLGMFADEPALMDQVLESAMRAREEHPLRADGG